MDAVILFSHGSLLCGAGEALQAHAARLQARGVAPLVEVGYLNYSEPPFVEAVAKCFTAGATQLLVAPYFLVPGKFVTTDLPQAIATAQVQFPNVTFTVADPLGYDELLADALIASAHAAGPHPRPLPQEQGRGAIAPASISPPSQRGTSVLGKGVGGLGPSALLVMVHGSPRPTANEDMFCVVEEVRQRGVFPIVEVGFLECNEPTIPEAIENCLKRRATRVLAVPYFLHTGKHVVEDLPTLLEEAQERYSHAEFRMGEYLGRSEHITEILAKRIRSAS